MMITQEALDDLRYSDLAKAEAQTMGRIDALEAGPERATFLGVLASIRRQQGLTRHARLLLDRAFSEITPLHHHGRGLLLQRLAYVEDDDGDTLQALQLTHEATSEMLLSGDDDAVGRTLADRARFEYHLEHHQVALDANEIARTLLRKESTRSRFMVELGVGLCCRHLGDFERARRAAARALVLEPVGPGLRLHALVLEAELREADGNLLEAAELFLRASREVARYSPGNGLVAALRGLQALARADQERANEELLSLARFLSPFARSSEISEPLRRLLNAREVPSPAQLELFTDHVRSALEKRRAARRKRTARLLNQPPPWGSG